MNLHRIRNTGKLLGIWLIATSAHAHLMPANNGTLNIVDGSAYLVLSVPVSSFVGVDDNGDGALSPAEFVAHRASLIGQVKRAVSLTGPESVEVPHGLLASPSGNEHNPTEPANAVTVLGRFPVQASVNTLSLHIDLYGEREKTSGFTIRVTDESRQVQRIMNFSPARPVNALFPGTFGNAKEFVASGATGLLTKLDHLKEALTGVIGQSPE